MRDGILYPIEIKKAASLGTETVKHFSVLQPVTEPERFGAVEQHHIAVGQGAARAALRLGLAAGSRPLPMV